MTVKSLLEKARSGAELTRGDALGLLSIETATEDYYTLIGAANAQSRAMYGGRGSILSQIGVEASPCPGNCAFCSLAESAFPKEDSFVLPLETAEETARLLIEQGTDELFLMTTANYTNSDFLEYAARVRRLVPEGMRFVANVGDFDLGYARELKKLGFTGVYHVCRLGEGVDNDLSVAQRVRTIEAAREAGLERYYCVEPIGPEHTYDEMITEMERARKFGADVAAVMKRTCVPGTRLHERGEVSSAGLAKICAVAALFIKPRRAMGVHEPDVLCLLSGANQIYAEVSVNPRDLSLSTETSRGASMAKAAAYLHNAGWKWQDKT